MKMAAKALGKNQDVSIFWYLANFAIRPRLVAGTLARDKRGYVASLAIFSVVFVLLPIVSLIAFLSTSRTEDQLAILDTLSIGENQLLVAALIFDLIAAMSCITAYLIWLYLYGFRTNSGSVLVGLALSLVFGLIFSWIATSTFALVGNGDGRVAMAIIVAIVFVPFVFSASYFSGALSIGFWKALLLSIFPAFIACLVTLLGWGLVIVALFRNWIIPPAVVLLGGISL